MRVKQGDTRLSGKEKKHEALTITYHHWPRQLTDRDREMEEGREGKK